MSDRDDDDHLKHSEPPAQLSLYQEPGWTFNARGSSLKMPGKEREREGSIVSDHLCGPDVSGVWPPSP